MAGRFLLGVFVLAVSAGCVASDEAEPDTTTASITAPEAVAPDTGVGSEQAGGSQQIVVAEASGDVVVLSESLDEVTRVVPSPSIDFKQPTWLDEDSIVFAELSSADGPSGLQAVDAASGATEWRVELETFPFYYLPAPAGSNAATTSLRNDPEGGLIAEVVSDDGSIEQISGASPFYSSWSPDGESLAIHTGQAQLSIRTGADDVTIADPSGAFQAPDWTADGIVTLRTVETGQVLSVWDNDDFTDVASVEGPVRFSAADGRVAIQSAAVAEGGGLQAGLRSQTLPEIPGGRLVVVDVASGSVTTVANQLVPLFEWSPGGDRLLYATFESDSSLDFQWHVWEDGVITDLSPFSAQPAWFRDVVPFFDQYVQSVSLWSAGGDRIAYPAVEDGRLVVIVESIDGSVRDSIPDAVWVSWSGVDAP